MTKQILSIQLKKENGKLIANSDLEVEQYKLFIASLDEASIVNALFELKTNDNTKSQLAKIHVCIKELAEEQGCSVQEMKKQVKQECGMSYKDQDKKIQYESFANCSKGELSNVIETIVQMGDFLNVNLNI